MKGYKMETSTNHSIKLIYDFKDQSFKPDIEPEVSPGETISFALVTIPPSASKFKVIMDEKGLFSPSEVDNSDTKMTLKQKLATRTTYRCELIDPETMKVLIVGSKASGGGVRPGK
jgi:hypothetical protein